MTGAMIKQEDEVEQWVHYLKDVNGILKLKDHVVVGQVSFTVLSVFK
jgi:hypothetical protein